MEEEKIPATPDDVCTLCEKPNEECKCGIPVIENLSFSKDLEKVKEEYGEKSKDVMSCFGHFKGIQYEKCAGCDDKDDCLEEHGKGGEKSEDITKEYTGRYTPFEMKVLSFMKDQPDPDCVITEVHLCPSCEKEFATCKGNPRFGTGEGNDNIYECDGHVLSEEFKEAFKKFKEMARDNPDMVYPVAMPQTLTLDYIIEEFLKASKVWGYDGNKELFDRACQVFIALKLYWSSERLVQVEAPKKKFEELGGMAIRHPGTTACREIDPKDFPPIQPGTENKLTFSNMELIVGCYQPEFEQLNGCSICRLEYPMCVIQLNDPELIFLRMKEIMKMLKPEVCPGCRHRLATSICKRDRDEEEFYERDCIDQGHKNFDDGHKSDCAVHNEPAYPAGPCDCGFEEKKEITVCEHADETKGDCPECPHRGGVCMQTLQEAQDALSPGDRIKVVSTLLGNCKPKDTDPTPRPSTSDDPIKETKEDTTPERTLTEEETKKLKEEHGCLTPDDCAVCPPEQYNKCFYTKAEEDTTDAGDSPTEAQG